MPVPDISLWRATGARDVEEVETTFIVFSVYPPLFWPFFFPATCREERDMCNIQMGDGAKSQIGGLLYA